MYKWYVRLLHFGALLALIVVVLGAWVRLTDAGLGCPDWPGCYGSIVVPDSETERADAQADFPDRPLVPHKAWNEMIHRYVATTLGMSIMSIALLAWRNRHSIGQPVKLPLLLLGVVIFQGLLGMWTVTLLLKPIIVMAHLLGGLTTLSLLFWLILEDRRRKDISQAKERPVVGIALAGLILLTVQIGLGGWTSANYAALACPDLPTCQGQWWPEEANFDEGFVMWRGLGVDYEGGVLDAPSRVAIHYTHRLGAMTTFLLLGFAALSFIRGSGDPTLSRAGMLVAGALIAQVILGISVVWFGLPLFLASAHNAVAALLLLSTINLNHAASLYHRTSVKK
jgi:cytochrome c oxidase assembly protein subunit 15